MGIGEWASAILHFSRWKQFTISLFIIFISTVIGAMLVEFLSDRYLPGIEFSGMHYLTVIFGGLIATMMAFLSLARLETLYEKIYHENEERKRAEALLEASRAEVEFYVDLLGHDINNMNQVAMGYTELAQGKLNAGGTLDSSDAGLLTKTLDMLVNSSNLIENVGKIRKARRGELNVEEIDLADVVDELRSTYFKAQDRNVDISYKVCKGCKVRADWLIKDVFFNLIGNAIKHANGKNVTIDVDIRHLSLDGGPYCEVSVADNGPGIPEEMKARIFKRFERGNRKTRGKGLGLYLVKTLVERFEGKVWVEDRIPGDHRQGSRFVVLLPAVVRY